MKERKLIFCFLERFITKLITILFVILSIIILLVILIGDKKNEVLAAELEVDTSIISMEVERIPIEVQMKRYIDSLPLPPTDITTSIIKEENIKEIEEETIEEGMIKEIEEKNEEIKEENEGMMADKIVEEEKEENQKQKAYEYSDVELLGRLMYAEEGKFLAELTEDEAKRVHMLAGSVVLNRLNMHQYGAKTIYDVIFYPGQYDCVSRGTIYQDVPEIVFIWAEELLTTGPIGPPNMIYQAEFEQGSETYEHIGNQYFCLE